ncbi:MAG TPA: ATP-binding protein [Candidatus Paceibacterota bacterium]|nr:ATP-binding protein [Candidatus Paceibacterota bacterium]
MKTLLVLAPHPDLVEALRQGLSAEQYRIVHRVGVDEAEPLLAHGLANACIVDAELTGVQEVWILEKLRRRAPKCPIILFTGSKQWEWEEEAYLKGATHVLAKPVRIRMLTALLDRLWATPALTEISPTGPNLPSESVKPAEVAVASNSSVQSNYQSLGALRGFSAILTHSLDADAMLKQFLLLLRELIGINRAAVFLHQPANWLGERAPGDDSRRMHAACAIGVSPNLLEHFELSFDGGIGGQVTRLGRILRRNSDEARRDRETQKEFELLGTQVAVPILDRETVVGVAVFDGHITGEPLANAELELIFHLLEQVGLAIKNIWLHDQLGGNHEMMAGILRELNNACIVVNRDLAILHSNKTARRFFTISNRRTGELEFSDLPQAIGAKIYQVLKTGTAVPSFKYEPQDSPGTVYNVSIVPFQRPNSKQPASALLMVEDLTQSEQLRRLEVETANLRLIRTMADRLAHEVGNAMVPLSTHQQLLADKYKDPEFRASLDAALADGVKRVTRLINQMRFLARDAVLTEEAFPMTALIEEAYEEARKHQPVKTAEFKYDDENKPFVVTGDRAALKHAFTEVIINALQANPSNPKIGVRLHAHSNGNGRPGLEIEVQDNGAGFTSEAAENAPSPFFTTRNVGLGLGLTVSRKIIETHRGKLEIITPKTGQSGIIRISLPVDMTSKS